MDKMRQWSILTTLGVLGVFAAGWLLLVSPQRSHAADLRTQAASKVQAENSLQAQVDQLNQQKKDLPAQQRQLDQIATQVPDNPSLPSLIRQLSAAAQGAGVALVSLAPAQPSMVTAAAPTTATAPTSGTAPAAAPATLAQIPLTLQVSGTYFNVESFFHAVEHLSRAMLVTQFTLAPGAAPDSTSSGTSPSTGSTSAAAKTGSTDTLTGQISAVVFESPQLAAPPVTTPVAPASTPATTPAQ